MRNIKSWTCSIYLHELIDTNFYNVSITNKITQKYYNLKELCRLDLILSDLPIKSINIIKFKDRIYIDNYKFILFFREYIKNHIKIKVNSIYTNNISEKRFCDLSVNERDKILNYLITCNIIEIYNDDIEVLRKILKEYLIIS
ncbi:hypothetical protein [Clostridium baratii]|uniref:hypothetical protein n=1 Tax=Clostridium baratii TaxID=1561 RepID=UPI00290009B4|nr:hypothetical protein [Clostridium baratii]MDU1053776.1 hypothetical protein [Clostridium baratii]